MMMSGIVVFFCDSGVYCLICYVLLCLILFLCLLLFCYVFVVFSFINPFRDNPFRKRSLSETIPFESIMADIVPPEDYCAAVQELPHTQFPWGISFSGCCFIMKYQSRPSCISSPREFSSSERLRRPIRTATMISANFTGPRSTSTSKAIFRASCLSRPFAAFFGQILYSRSRTLLYPLQSGFVGRQI